MPWTSSDATKHTKKAAGSQKARDQWQAVANSARNRGASDGAAIRMANGVIKKRVSATRVGKRSAKRR